MGREFVWRKVRPHTQSTILKMSIGEEPLES